MNKKKIIVVSSRFPYPLEKGDKLRLYHQMKELSSKYQLTLIAIADNDPTSSDISAMEEICTAVHFFKINLLQRVWSMFIGLFWSRPFQVSFFFNYGVKQKINQIIDQVNPDGIYCQLIRVSEYVKDRPEYKIVDFMDAFGWGMNKRAESKGLLFSLVYKLESYFVRKYEFNIFNKFNGHTIISEQDRDRMDIEQRDKIRILPNGVDVNFFIGNDDHLENYQICFVGNMGYLPNVEAVKYLAKEIVPELKSKHENFRVLIAGARPTAEVKSLASDCILVKGWFEDIRDAYNDASIFVAPIFLGIGQQNKILEAMAMGVPCITTSVVNNSINAIPGESILIADNAQEYIMAINYLMDNPVVYQLIKDKAKTFVIENYSWESQCNELFDIFVTETEQV